MTETDTPRRQRLSAGVTEILSTLPAIGRLMVTANHLGATHERIGVVESVTFADGWAVLAGAEHESRIALASIAEVVVDRSSVMRDKVFPRLDLYDAEGEIIAGIVGFDGLAPFDAAIAPLGTGVDMPAKPEKPGSKTDDPAETDPGRRAFEQALAAATPIVIGFRRPGFAQFWRGTVEGVKPAMGFTNVMRSDFHLHLKAGAVAEWRLDASTGEQRAFSPDGQPLGLFIAA